MRSADAERELLIELGRVALGHGVGEPGTEAVVFVSAPLPLVGDAPTDFDLCRKQFDIKT